MQTGYILLPRSVLDQYAWTTKSAATTKIFLTLALKASHKDFHHPAGIELKQGQLLTSSRTLASECRISRNTLKNILTRLQDAQQITLQDTHKGTVVTICNYIEFTTYNNTNTPTNTPTNTSQVGQTTAQSGSKIDPPYRQVSNKETKDGFSVPVLTENDFDTSEVSFFREFYPFHTDKEKTVSMLKTRGFTENAVASILEKHIYPNEYGYRKVNA